MDLIAHFVAPVSPEALFAEVATLDRYARWLDIVCLAVPEGNEDGEPAWRVDLKARIGPFARSKRLRMVQAHVAPPRAVRFERRELDRRNHSAWILEAEVVPVAEGSQLTMRLHYGGSLFGPVLERVLRDEIERSRPRLLALVTEAS